MLNKVTCLYGTLGTKHLIALWLNHESAQRLPVSLLGATELTLMDPPQEKLHTLTLKKKEEENLSHKKKCIKFLGTI